MVKAFNDTWPVYLKLERKAKRKRHKLMWVPSHATESQCMSCSEFDRMSCSKMQVKPCIRAMCTEFCCITCCTLC